MAVLMTFRLPFGKFCLPALLAVLFCGGGCGAPSFLITPVANTSSLDEVEVQPGKGWWPPRVAIIEVEGMLMNARAGGLFQAQENPVSRFAQQMEAAERDKSVRAVVLRVNCPGGTVTATDTMYQIVKRFKEKTKKPVVVSTQEVAASGGYYVSLASDQIFVQPTSVVGSIGVIFETMQFKGTLDKLGITAQSIKSGSLKDMGSPFKLLRDDEKQVMQEMVDEYFTRFVALVRERRGPLLKEDALTDLDAYKKEGYAGIFSGRVYSGDRAVQLGLADRTGMLTDAIDAARKLAKVPNAGAILYKRPYGYGGSIYANSYTPTPKSNVLRFELPETSALLPDGFYYLWRP
jgi:protease IV